MGMVKGKDSGSGSQLDQQNKRVRRWIWLLMLFLLVALSSIASGNYLQQIHRLTHTQEKQLAVISNSSVSEIVTWRTSRLGDGKIIQSNQQIALMVKNLLDDPANRSNQEQNLEWMSNTRSAYGYKAFTLYDISGKKVIEDPLIQVPQSPGLQSDLATVIGQKKVVLSDLYLDPTTSTVLMDLYIPIHEPYSDLNNVIAVLDLRIDPNQTLYPIIMDWHIPTDTGETALFRVDGKSVTYLNALRFQPFSALKLQFPLDTPDLPVAVVAQGNTEIHQGVDYRGHEVIYTGRAIPGTDWFLLSKMDKDEVFTEVRRQGAILAVILTSVFISVIAVGQSLFERQRRFYGEEVHYLQNEREQIRNRYRLLLNAANDFITIIDQNGRIIDFNDRALEAYGYTADEFSGKMVMDLRTSKYREAISDYIDRIKKSGSLREHLEHQRKDGTAFFVDVSIRQFEIENQKFYLDIIRDMSENVAAQKKLEESEARYRGMIEHASDGIFTTDMTGRFIAVNDMACHILGYTRKEILQKHVLDLISAESLEEESTHFWEIANGTRSYVVTERNVIRKDGSLLPVEVSGFKLTEDRVQGVVRDISERVRYRQEIEVALARYRQFFEMNPIPTYIFDIANNRILDANEAAAKYYGYDRNEFIELTIGKIHIEDVNDKLLKVFHDIEGQDILHKHRKKDGTEGYVEVHAHEVEFDGKPARIVLEIDVTEKLKAEQVLKENLNNLRTIIDTSPLALITLNKKGIATSWNKAAEQIFGWNAEEVIGTKPEIFLESGENNLASVLKRILVSPQSIAYEGMRKRKDGSLVNVQVSATTIRDYRDRVSGVLGIIEDITEKKLVEASQKALAEERDSLLSRLQLQFSNIPVGFLLTDEDLNILDWNPQAEKIFGYAREEMIGKSEFGTIIPMDQMQVVKYVAKRTIMHNQMIVSTNENLTKEGRRIMVEWRNTPLWDESGKLIAMMNTAIDVADKVEIEKKIRESEEKLRAFFDSKLIGIFFADLDGRVYTANDYYLDTIGYSQDDLESGKISWNEITPPEYLVLDDQAIKQAKRDGVCSPY